MAPRGIVAAAAASTFGAQLAAQHIGGAAKILPVTFLVIVATVALYGLTTVPVARGLGVTRGARTRPLLAGGDPWVIDPAGVLRAAGLDVVMWAASQEEREQIEKAGPELAPGDLLASTTIGGGDLEGITSVLLLTGEDDFNALACTIIAGAAETAVYRLAPRHPSHGVVGPFTSGETVFAPGLTRLSLAQRHDPGARITTQPAGDTIPAGADLLFLISPDGTVIPETSPTPAHPPGGEFVLLGPAPTAEAWVAADRYGWSAGLLAG